MRLAHPAAGRFAGLEWVPNPVLLLTRSGLIEYANPAAEDVLRTSASELRGRQLAEFFSDETTLLTALGELDERKVDLKRLDAFVSLRREPGSGSRGMQAYVGRFETAGLLLLELVEFEQQIRQEREDHVSGIVAANKELIRNLAHEIKNPLGGIRGAAQLLELEVTGSAYAEYAQVIVSEADRLQDLVDRLLAPHRRPQMIADVNIHEVLERVRALILAEFPTGLHVARDYDTSLPEFRGDKELIIQAVLNIAHNAAHILAKSSQNRAPRIIFQTRVARQITFGKQLHRLALDLHVLDNGPGVAPELLNRIFLPLVSGREGGSGLGLTLAQTYIQQHDGAISCESVPGRTDFRVLIPLY